MYFEKKIVLNFENDEGEKSGASDTGFWVGLTPKGPWESIRSFLPLSVVTKTLGDDFVALEVVTKNGKKHIIFRALATVTNDSDITLDISPCHESMIHTQDLSSEGRNYSIFVEEIFENQRNHPVSGGNDPGRWSTRDYAYSSNVGIT